MTWSPGFSDCHAGADLAHDSGAFMAENGGELALGIEARKRVGVGVADAGRHHFDEDFAGLRPGESIVSIVRGLLASQATAARLSIGVSPTEKESRSRCATPPPTQRIGRRRDARGAAAA